MKARAIKLIFAFVLYAIGFVTSEVLDATAGQLLQEEAKDILMDEVSHESDEKLKS